MTNVTPYRVLVVGGSGFLGQHVVGLLQTRANHVTEIRVLDVAGYINKTGWYIFVLNYSIINRSIVKM